MNMPCINTIEHGLICQSTTKLEIIVLSGLMAIIILIIGYTIYYLTSYKHKTKKR